MVVEEMLPNVDGSSQDVEWLGDSGASRHVCNDMSLLWDVKVREDPILLRQLSKQVDVYMTGTVKLECTDKEGVLVILQLFDTLYIRQANVCLFSLQKMQKAHCRLVEQQTYRNVVDPKRERALRGEHQ